MKLPKSYPQLRGNTEAAIIPGKTRTRQYKQGVETVYRGIKYRSRWEVAVAKLLIHSGTYYQYEPQRFYLSPGLTYLPDFAIPTVANHLGALYVEVKGTFNREDRAKHKLFSRNHFLKVLDKSMLEQISGRKAAFFSSPKILEYKPSIHEIDRFRRFIYDTQLSVY